MCILDHEKYRTLLDMFMSLFVRCVLPKFMTEKMIRDLLETMPKKPTKKKKQKKTEKTT